MHESLSKRDKRVFEITLILVCLGLTCLLYTMQGYKMVILNLFFLPVALSGFFLGRYLAGLTALLCALLASCVTALCLADLVPPVSALVVALAVTVWAAALGLTALLIGTLSDDRNSKLQELHEAYVGVVEVLSQYLQCSQPHAKAPSVHVAKLSQQVAAAMKLSPRQIDDVRVAALLHGVGNIEVTTRVIRRAVGTLEAKAINPGVHTFQGADLVLSLGAVFKGVIPLLANQGEGIAEVQGLEELGKPAEIPVGAEIIRAVRSYSMLTKSTVDAEGLTPVEIVRKLRRDRTAHLNPDVLDAMERIVSRIDHNSPNPAQAATLPQL